MNNKVIPLGLITLLTTLTLSSCSLFNKEDEIVLDATITTEVDESTEETDIITPSLFAPYVLVAFGDDYTDPYPLKEITYTGDNKLKIADASIEGSNDLDLFVMTLKDAVSRKDDKQLLSMISDKIQYTTEIGNGKNDFILAWGLNDAPANSDLWAVLEELLPYGGKLVYEDLYQIPYMYDNLNLESPSGVAIGDNINLRTEPSINGEAFDQLNFDYIDVIEYSDNYYTLEGEDYPWVKIIKDGTKEGYVVSKFIYTINDYHIAITRDNGYWEITTIMAGK